MSSSANVMPAPGPSALLKRATIGRDGANVIWTYSGTVIATSS
jgi:hypothetical protein